MKPGEINFFRFSPLYVTDVEYHEAHALLLGRALTTDQIHAKCLFRVRREYLAIGEVVVLDYLPQIFEMNLTYRPSTQCHFCYCHHNDTVSLAVQLFRRIAALVSRRVIHPKMTHITSRLLLPCNKKEN